MTSTAASPTPSPRAVARAAVVTHGKAQTIGPAFARLEAAAAAAGVELLFSEEEAGKHGRPVTEGSPDLAVVLGGDGTMLRGLSRFLGAAVPVVGVNFGRVGFLCSIHQSELEEGLARVFAGEYEVVELPTLEVEAGEERRVAVNDLVVTSSVLGRMVELEWAVGGERLGVVPCDGIICSTPPGSTAYNLSNGGPVLVWGIDAMAVTFVAPHALDARPIVIPPGRDLVIWNRTPDVPAAALVDGHRGADLEPGGRVVARVGPQRSLLATLPEATFFRRYRETFAS